MGYLDAHHGRPLMLTLRDPAIAAEALPDKPEPYRNLDTGVLEAIVLQGALGMSEDDISHLHGLDYARDTAQARERVESGEAQAAFFMRGTPVSRCVTWRQPGNPCLRRAPTSFLRCSPAWCSMCD